MIQIELPLIAPSLNVMLKCHWSERTRLKGQWAIVLKNKIMAALDFKGITKSQYCRFVQIHAFRSKLLDYDNLVGGLKSVVIDNLKDIGIIEDDSPDKLQVTYLQTKTKKALEGTLIAIW